MILFKLLLTRLHFFWKLYLCPFGTKSLFIKNVLKLFKVILMDLNNDVGDEVQMKFNISP